MNKQNSDKTILIEIPAYKDPDLLNTVSSALIQAEFPERIHFGVCYQDDDLAVLKKLRVIPNTQVIHVPLSEARGSCYARNLCQKLLSDEDYIFHIDSHMRFVKHWDSLIIEELNRFSDPKGFLSTYVNSANDHMHRQLNDSFFDKPAVGMCIAADRFRQPNSQISLAYYQIYFSSQTDPRIGLTSPFVSGHYLFGPAIMDREILFDPNMFFYGDELPMAIRYYTHGYNCYNAGNTYAYHYYLRAESEQPSNEFAKMCCAKETERILALVGISGDASSLAGYGLGSVRSLEQYEMFAGVDFKNRRVSYTTKTGYYDQYHSREEFARMSMTSSQQFDSRLYCESRSAIINVCVVDLHNSTQDFIKTANKTATHPERLKFRTISNEKLQVCGVCEKPTYGYVMQLLSSSLADTKQDEIILFVNSGTILLSGWDSYYVEEILKNAANVVLTEYTMVCHPEELKEYTGGSGANAFLAAYAIEKGCLKFGMGAFIQRLNMYERMWPILGGDVFICRASAVKKVPFDPNVNFESFVSTYSMRLFTSGFDICYLPCCHAYRTSSLFDDPEAGKQGENFPIEAVMGALGPTKMYDYVAGTVRSVDDWRAIIGIESYDYGRVSSSRVCYNCIPFVTLSKP